MIELIHTDDQGAERHIWVPDEQDAAVRLAKPTYRRAQPEDAPPVSEEPAPSAEQRATET